jgi:head-tail adaptor
LPSAGRMLDKVSFQQRKTISDDGFGNERQAWEEQFQRSAEFIMRPGSESALAARLEGRQPVTMIVRYDRNTATIGADWRAVSARPPHTIYAIHTAEDMDRKRQWISILAEAGVSA